jgi:hypothetical protein
LRAMATAHWRCRPFGRNGDRRMGMKAANRARFWTSRVATAPRAVATALERSPSCPTGRHRPTGRSPSPPQDAMFARAPVRSRTVLTCADLRPVSSARGAAARSVSPSRARDRDLSPPR